jgi:hypothetical protein
MSVIYNIDIFAELPFCRPFIGPAQGSSEIKSMTHFSEYSPKRLAFGYSLFAFGCMSMRYSFPEDAPAGAPLQLPADVMGKTRRAGASLRGAVQWAICGI